MGPNAPTSHVDSKMKEWTWIFSAKYSIICFSGGYAGHPPQDQQIRQTTPAPLCKGGPGGQTEDPVTTKPAPDTHLLCSWIKPWISNPTDLLLKTLPLGGSHCTISLNFFFVLIQLPPLLLMVPFWFRTISSSVVLAILSHSNTAQREKAKLKFSKPKGSLICFTVRTKHSKHRKGYI